MINLEIFNAFTFDAAHRLPNVPENYKCRRLHGHTFRVEIHVSDELDPEKGWIIDFGEIKEIVKPILDVLDHNYLNEIEGLENPTSENIAIWLWNRLKPKLPVLTKVIVQESCNSGAVYP